MLVGLEDVTFEVGCVDELKLLQILKVDRERMVLTVSVLTMESVAMFGDVGAVVLHAGMGGS